MIVLVVDHSTLVSIIIAKSGPFLDFRDGRKDHDIIKSIIRSLVMSSTVSTNTPANRIRYRITLSENTLEIVHSILCSVMILTCIYNVARKRSLAQSEERTLEDIK